MLIAMHMNRSRWAVSFLSVCSAFTFFLSAPSSLAGDFTGVLYEKGSERKKPLFRFDHKESTQPGNKLIYKNTFTDMGGKTVVTEEVIFEKAPDGALKVQKYGIDHLQASEKGQVVVNGGKVEFEYTKEGKTEKDDEDWEPNFVVGPSIVDYLRKNWDKILKGDTVDTRYAALDRKETVGFKFFKVEEKKVGDRDAVVVKMKPTSFVIAAIVDPLFFTLDKKTVNLLELTGRTLPRQLVDGKLKPLDVDAVYQHGTPPKPAASPSK